MRLPLFGPSADLRDVRRATLASRKRILGLLDGAADLTFVRSTGNLGDELIFAGTRQLLAGTPSREVGLDDVESVTGETAVVAGGGSWCSPYHGLARLFPAIERRFRCAHGSYAGRPIRGRLCHVPRAPSRAAATPHTVHDAYALGA